MRLEAVILVLALGWSPVSRARKSAPLLEDDGAKRPYRAAGELAIVYVF